MIENLNANSTSWVDDNAKIENAPYYRITSFTELRESSIPESISVRWQYFELVKKSNIGTLLICEFIITNDFIIASDFQTVKLFNAETFNQVAILYTDNSIPTFAVSNKNNYLYYGTESRKVIIFYMGLNTEIDELNLFESNKDQLIMLQQESYF